MSETSLALMGGGDSYAPSAGSTPKRKKKPFCLKGTTDSPNSRCKRSFSLQDLTLALEQDLALQRQHQNRFEGNEMAGNAGTQNLEPGVSDEPMVERETLLALKTVNCFLKNTWRRRRDDNKKLEEAMNSANAKMANMNMQISTLKHLLASDEQVMVSWAKEIQGLKSRLKAAAAQMSSLKEENSLMEAKMERMDEEMENVKMELMNEKNTTILLKSEASAFESQLQKEREKLAKIKRDKQTLMQKVENLNENLKMRDEKINTLTIEVGNFDNQRQHQMQLTAQAESKLNEGEISLRKANEEILNLKNEVNLLKSEKKSSNSTIHELEMSLEEKEKQYISLERFCQEQMIRLVELESEGYRRRDEPESWAGRLMNAAGSLLQLPLAVIEAITFPSGQPRIQR